MKLTGSQGSESVLENYLNCNQDELCQVTSLKGERINIHVTYINTRTDTYGRQVSQLYKSTQCDLFVASSNKNTNSPKYT